MTTKPDNQARQPTEASRQAADEVRAHIKGIFTLSPKWLALAFDRRAALEREQAEREIVEWLHNLGDKNRPLGLIQGDPPQGVIDTIKDAIERGDHRKEPLT